jgi:hypothetical protein
VKEVVSVGLRTIFEGMNPDASYNDRLESGQRDDWVFVTRGGTGDVVRSYGQSLDFVERRSRANG